jgi:hypothetical protein
VQNQCTADSWDFMSGNGATTGCEFCDYRKLPAGRRDPAIFTCFGPHPWTSLQIGWEGKGGGTRFVSFNNTQCMVWLDVFLTAHHELTVQLWIYVFWVISV